MKYLKLILIIFISYFILHSQSNENAYKILKKIDELYKSNSSYAEVEMKIETKHWKRTLFMKMWTEGKEKAFIRIILPKKERGVATLKLKNQMWNYLPKTNKIIKIPPSMMMGSWMGSDFSNDDLVKEYTFIDDYTFEFTEVDNPEKDLLYISCKPKPDVPVIWEKIIIAVNKKDLLPVWEKYYNEKGKEVRVMYFKEVKTFGKKRIPSVMELIPLNKKGHKTTITYKKVKFDIKLDKSIFSIKNLRKRF